MTFTYNFNLLPQYLEILMSRLRIAVIHGGDSNKQEAVIYKTHNPRSTKTYQAVAYEIALALENIGFKQVYVLADDMTLPEKLQKENIHLAWLNTGGVQGYNPVCHTPAVLEMLGIPYLGHNPLNSSILDNKHAFKRELQGLGFSTPAFMIWHFAQGKFQPEKNSRFKTIFGDYPGPFVVKPVSGRASLNVYVVDQREDLPGVIAQIHEVTHNTAMIESYLPGREFCVSVCGYVLYSHNTFKKNFIPFSFSTIERVLEADERIFTSMDKKAITASRLCLVEEIKLKEELLYLARRIYWEFNLNSLVRLDLRQDTSGQLQILEVNPKPDLKKPTDQVTSFVTQGLLEYKMSYEDFILSLLADRLDYLFTHHANNISHIVELL